MNVYESELLRAKDYCGDNGLQPTPFRVFRLAMEIVGNPENRGGRMIMDLWRCWKYRERWSLHKLLHAPIGRRARRARFRLMRRAYERLCRQEIAP